MINILLHNDIILNVYYKDYLNISTVDTNTFLNNFQHIIIIVFVFFELIHEHLYNAFFLNLNTKI